MSTLVCETDHLTLGEAAASLGYTYRHVRRLVAQGKLPAINLGATGRGPTWRVTEAELERFKRERSRA